MLSLPGVPVLVYHGVTDNTPAGLSLRELKYWVSPREFSAHLDCIRRNGFAVRSLDDFWNSESDGESRAAIITFDDGCITQYTHAFPLLVKSGYRASFFLNTSTVGAAGYMSWPEIAEMQRSGMSFQSHSHDHVYLSRLPLSTAKAQIEKSKAILEDRLGCAVEYLATPYGDYSRQVLALAGEAGYRALCTGRSLPARKIRGLIDRTVVYRKMSEAQFRALLNTSVFAYGNRIVRAGLKQIPKRVWIRLRPQEVTAV